MADDQNPQQGRIETHRGDAGEAQRMNQGARAARAAMPDSLPKEALDQRQARIGERRRRGGPLLEAEAEEAPRTRGEADPSSAAPDVPPTESADPPE